MDDNDIDDRSPLKDNMHNMLMVVSSDREKGADSDRYPIANGNDYDKLQF